MRIYISGPMTGKKDLNYNAFCKADAKLTKAGHVVVNPFNAVGYFGSTYDIEESFAALYRCQDEKHEMTSDSYHRDYIAANLARCVMDADRAAVRSCDAIYLLRGWENSRGAKNELAEAINHNLKVILEGNAK